MKSLAILLLLAQVILCRHQIPDTEIDAKFEKFISDHGKTYQNAEEKSKRKAIFADTYKFIAAYNEMDEDVVLGVNKFADLTDNEVKAMFSLSATVLGCSQKTLTNTPVTSIDWRAQGAVTSVKDQGNCGSCWAFSSTGAIEGLYKIKKGSLVDFSEQQLVDCAGGVYQNAGCDGGFMDYAFNYVRDKGIVSASSYPYTGVQGTCKTLTTPFKITGCNYVTANDNDQLLKALNLGPVSVAVKASNNVFMYYTSGIITSNCGTSSSPLDHGVLLVGAGITNGVPYWIVKNSWGTSWGQNGYVYIKRSTGISNSVCGIAMEASYPTLTV
jgi:C1A family cysteine protease